MDQPASEQRRSRRVFLAGLVGATAAGVATRLAAPLDAAAANGDAVRLGQVNTASVETSIRSTGTSGALYVYSAGGHSLQASSDGGGEAGLFFANGSGGAGVRAAATLTTGAGVGVDAQSSAADGAGVISRSNNSSTGIKGVSRASGGADGATPKKTGVYGYAAQDSTALGVLGESTAGLGVKGKATTGSGVYGTSQSGFGVVGFSGTGTAAFFQTGAPGTGVALQTVGRVKFDKSVGRATIAIGTNRIVVTPGIDLTPTAAVVATLQGPAGGALVSHVTINTTSNTFTIWLTRNTTVAVSVAWHVFG